MGSVATVFSELLGVEAALLRPSFVEFKSEQLAGTVGSSAPSPATSAEEVDTTDDLVTQRLNLVGVRSIVQEEVCPVGADTGLCGAVYLIFFSTPAFPSCSVWANHTRPGSSVTVLISSMDGRHVSKQQSAGRMICPKILTAAVPATVGVGVVTACSHWLAHLASRCGCTAACSPGGTTPGVGISAK